MISHVPLEYRQSMYALKRPLSFAVESSAIAEPAMMNEEVSPSTDSLLWDAKQGIFTIQMNIGHVNSTVHTHKAEQLPWSKASKALSLYRVRLSNASYSSSSSK